MSMSMMTMDELAAAVKTLAAAKGEGTSMVCRIALSWSLAGM